VKSPIRPGSRDDADVRSGAEGAPPASAGLGVGRQAAAESEPSIMTTSRFDPHLRMTLE
jgi:hypothetical protein